MHVYESACSKKKSKAEKLNRIALMEFTMPIKMNLNAFIIEVMLRGKLIWMPCNMNSRVSELHLIARDFKFEKPISIVA